MQPQVINPDWCLGHIQYSRMTLYFWIIKGIRSFGRVSWLVRGWPPKSYFVSFFESVFSISEAKGTLLPFSAVWVSTGLKGSHPCSLSLFLQVFLVLSLLLASLSSHSTSPPCLCTSLPDTFGYPIWMRKGWWGCFPLQKWKATSLVPSDIFLLALGFLKVHHWHLTVDFCQKGLYSGLVKIYIWRRQRSLTNSTNRA